MKNALLVYPRHPPTYWGNNFALDLLGIRAAFPPLGLLTVAAMFPSRYNLRVVDLNVTSLEDRDLEWADLAFTSTMIVQRPSLERVVERCNRAGVPVIAGGPHPTTFHHEMEGIDHFVLDEVEETFPAFLRDLENGTAKKIHRAPEEARRDHHPASALRPHRHVRLLLDVPAVLARMSLRLRVLRHHQAVRPRVAHEVARADGGRVRSPLRAGMARPPSSWSTTTSSATSAR